MLRCGNEAGEPVPAALVPAAVPAPVRGPKNARFAGFYAGITGGYEIPVSKHYVSHPFPGSDLGTPVVPVDSLQGGKAGGIIGYNAVVEPLLVGFEARAQYSFSHSFQAFSRNVGDATFPKALGTCFPTCGDPATISWTPVSLGSSFLDTAARYHHWQVDVSARTGILSGDWMIYAKTGLGLEDSLFRTSNSSSSVLCDPVLGIQRTNPFSDTLIATGCKSTTTVSTMFGTTEQAITPIAILGAGVERNFGDFFMRAEGEFIAHFIKGGGVYYSPTANFTGGYRF